MTTTRKLNKGQPPIILMTPIPARSYEKPRLYMWKDNLNVGLHLNDPPSDTNTHQTYVRQFVKRFRRHGCR